ncbi:MAG TPA: squalene synthase HpnC [Gemmatimonadota bacterium]|nr:squalene synthase HpnC [Gemmatimonadota bacterium]
MTLSTADLRRARARCAGLARAHYENFPVRSRLLPRTAREDLAAIYAFCRTTDDLGDEFSGDRLEALEAWEHDTLAALAGHPPPESSVLAALAATAARRDLAPDLFIRLIEANRRDQAVARYPDEAALLDYCAHSATPVGRMVLGAIGQSGRGLAVYADATCIGLQLANFWQDLDRDWAQGRCYLPLDACARHGVDPAAELGDARASAALRALVAEQVGRARGWLRRGWPLGDRLPARWRPLVRGFTRGGWAICDAIAARDFDTLSVRPEVGRGEKRWIVGVEFARGPWRRVRLPAPRGA